MDKIAIVTGVTGNLGKVVAGRLITDGFIVIGTVHAANEIAFDFPPEKFERVVVDLTNEADGMKLVEGVIKKHGRLDVAVLTVGGFATGGISDTATSAVSKQYKVNFETAYNVAQPSFVQMLKQKTGKIFLVGSRPGLDSKFGKGMIAYGLSKSLLFRLAELMNAEAHGTDVVTSVLVPGTIDTPQNREAMPKADFDSWVTPEKIADVITFYCSEKATVLKEPIIKVYGRS